MTVHIHNFIHVFIILYVNFYNESGFFRHNSTSIDRSFEICVRNTYYHLKMNERIFLFLEKEFVIVKKFQILGVNLYYAMV